MLGLYVSDHPLMGAEAALRRKTDHTIVELAELEDGAMRTIGGVVTGLQRKWTKKGDLMAVFILEDLQSSIEVMVFPKTMSDIGHKLADDAVLVVKGRVDKRDDQPKFIAMDVEIFEGITDGAPPLRLKVSPAPPRRAAPSTTSRRCSSGSPASRRCSCTSARQGPPPARPVLRRRQRRPGRRAPRPPRPRRHPLSHDGPC